MRPRIEDFLAFSRPVILSDLDWRGPRQPTASPDRPTHGLRFGVVRGLVPTKAVFPDFHDRNLLAVDLLAPEALCHVPVQIVPDRLGEHIPDRDGEAFGLLRPVVALDRVSMDVRKGEIYGVIGMSGAGKSTLIRCINRLDVPTGGEVLYRGQDVLKMSRPDLLKLRRKVRRSFSSSIS